MKIIDFNIAIKVKEEFSVYNRNNFMINEFIGYNEYTAPEMNFNSDYSELVDLWGAGYILEEMTKSIMDIYEIQELKEGLLEEDPEIRMTANEALNHRFFYKSF